MIFIIHIIKWVYMFEVLQYNILSHSLLLSFLLTNIICQV